MPLGYTSTHRGHCLKIFLGANTQTPVCHQNICEQTVSTHYFQSTGEDLEHAKVTKLCVGLVRLCPLPQTTIQLSMGLYLLGKMGKVRRFYRLKQLATRAVLQKLEFVNVGLPLKSFCTSALYEHSFLPLFLLE